MSLVVVVSIASALLASILTYALVFHFHGKRVASSVAGQDRVLDLRLSQEFERGKAAGRAEELGKFELTYEPFVETIEEYMGLKKRSLLGYDMQISYAGFPVGHRTRYVTHKNVEFDEKRIETLLNSEVASAVNGIVQLAATKGLGAKSLPAKRKVGAT
jgi:hypothetical protein